MSNVTEIRLVLHADADELKKIIESIGIDGSSAVYERLSLTGTGEDDDSLIQDAGIELQVSDMLSIVGLHDWGLHGYTFCSIVKRLRELAPSLREVYLEQFDPLLDYFEVDIWEQDMSSWYQSRVAQAEYANGILSGVHYAVQHKLAEEGKEYPSDIELDLQRDALRHAYNQAATHGWFGFIVERSPLHG